MRFDTISRSSGALAILVVLGVALGGCAAGSAPGGGSGSITSGPPSPVGVGGLKRDASGAIDACALVNVAQIGEAIGTPAIEAVPYGGAECRWKVTPLIQFPGSVDPWVDVQFFAGDTEMRAVEVAPGTNGVVAIEGLGDRAFRTNQYRHLWVKHGSDVFVVRSSLTALGDDTEVSRAAAEAIEVLLARLVLDQL